MGILLKSESNFRDIVAIHLQEKLAAIQLQYSSFFPASLDFADCRLATLGLHRENTSVAYSDRELGKEAMEIDRRRNTPRNIATFAGRMINPNDECSTSRIVEGNEVEQYLPGLPNYVVLDQIVPKLPWRAFHILSCVSPYWREAIQSRQVYSARVRAKSMDTLVVLNHNHPDNKFIHSISLYSMRDDSWHRLPQFPFSKKGIPRSCQYVALDGKLYVLGGIEPNHGYDYEDDSKDPKRWRDDGEEVSCEPQDGSGLYVLDVVGQKGWQQCAKMPKPRLRFACGVLDGKVYVFGGFVVGGCTEECLVYDPKEDEWSSIAPMTEHREGHHAVLVGDEFWVHGGSYGSGREALDPEVYHPGKDRWQYIESDPCYESERFFTVKGKLYLMTPAAIYVREPWRCLHSISSPDDGPWKCLHSISSPDDGDDEDEVEVVATEAIDGEVLALIYYSRAPKGALLRVEGFGYENREIELKVVAREIFIGHRWYPHLMCPIQL